MKINVIIKNQPSDEAIVKTAKAIQCVFDKHDIYKYNATNADIILKEVS